MRDIKYQKEKPTMRHFMNHAVRDVQEVVVARTTGQSKKYRLIEEDK